MGTFVTSLAATRAASTHAKMGHRWIKTRVGTLSPSIPLPTLLPPLACFEKAARVHIPLSLPQSFLSAPNSKLTSLPV